MSNSSVPDLSLTAVGLSIPAESDVLAGVQADMNAAFGGNLNPALSTPQGQLASSQAALVAAKNDLFAQFVNQVDPATASGRMQDAIGRLYRMNRLPATPTKVQVLCSGLKGVLIPAGALVQDSSGNLYACVAGGTIPAEGSTTLEFDAIVLGPTPCPAGSISTIYQSVIGWDSATNVVAGVPGAAVESRADFEYRRQNSIAVNAGGTLGSIYGEVFTVAGVTDVYAIENKTDSPVVNGAVTLVPHSVYVAVVGGADADVAAAIWRKASNGCNFNGNTTVTVQDTSGYLNPIPSYAVSFQRPSNLPIYIAITVQNLSGLSNAVLTPMIQNAVLAAFNGSDGGQRARVGATLFASRFFAAISSVAQLAIVQVLLSATASPSAALLNVGIDQNPTLTAANISVGYV